MTDLADIFANIFDATSTTGLAVGLSGGADSWALALLAHDWCRARQLPFVALTVDHRLRTESTDEAASVAAACASRNIQHHTLVWQHGGIDSRKQERARAARYDLMGDWCAKYGFSHLLTAHHADDQAETILLRLAKGSGAAGLSGIAPGRALNDRVTLLRPLLAVPKDDLIAYATAAGVPIVEDPSNSNPAYARARLRNARSVLEAEGLTRDNLLKLATTAREEQDALAYAAATLLLADRRMEGDSLSIAAAPWMAAPAALRRSAFLSIWRDLTGSRAYQPRREEIDQLTAALANPGTKRTLGGLICAHQRERLVFRQEA